MEPGESMLADRWAMFERSDPGVVLDAARELSEAPGHERDFVVSWLAWSLGYSLRLQTPEALVREPIWYLLGADAFDRLGEPGEELVQRLVKSADRTSDDPLPDVVAAAAVAVWCHGSDEGRRREARELLEGRPLPSDRAWLWRLVRRLESAGMARGGGRPGLFQVAALQLGSRFWKIAADIASLYLVRRCAPGGTPPTDRWMIEGCDRAAERYWRRLGDWIELAAEAACGGSLGDPWLEKVVSAALRRTHADERHHDRLANYHARRPYDADRRRLHELYRHALESLFDRRPSNRNWARRHLLEELAATAAEHPHRAMVLAELMVVYERPLRWRSHRSRMHHALRQVAARDELRPHERMLAELYVATFSVEPHARRFVADVRDRIDWSASNYTSRDQLEAWDRVLGKPSVEQYTVSYAGTTLELSDKDAATNVIYYAEKPLAPNRLLRTIRRLLSPIDALGTSGESSMILRRTVVTLVGWIDACVGGVDRRERTVDTFAAEGVAVEDFEDIGGVGLEFIEGEFESLLVRRLLVAGLSGGISGAIGGAGHPWVALAGVPIVLGTVLEAASRYCWIYGFDPIEEPEIPLEILAVAVEGPSPGGPDRDELYHEMAESAVHTSFVVEAVATRNVARLVARTLGGVARSISRSDYGHDVADLVERSSQRALATEYGDWLGQLLGGVIGAAADAAILYDVSEAAEVVLTDRFLARKYDDWERTLGARPSDSRETQPAPHRRAGE